MFLFCKGWWHSSAVIVELWQLGGLLCFLVCSPSASYTSTLSTFLTSWWIKAYVQAADAPVCSLGSQHAPSLCQWLHRLAGPCTVLAEAGARVSSCHQHRNPRGGRFLRQSYLLMCLIMGICWRVRATRALLSDLRGIWLENVWFCSRLRAI